CSFDLLFHFISLITTTNTYSCTLHILIIPTLLTSIAAIIVPITVHIAYLFLTVHIYLFTYYTLHMHILFLLFCTSGWMLNCIPLPTVLCAMTIKLNLILNLIIMTPQKVRQLLLAANVIPAALVFGQIFLIF